MFKRYLSKYQSNDPLVPIMTDHALDIIKTLMSIVYNADHVNDVHLKIIY